MKTEGVKMTVVEEKDLTNLLRIGTIDRLKNTSMLTHVLDIDLSDLSTLRLSDYIIEDTHLLSNIYPDLESFEYLKDVLDSYFMLEILTVHSRKHLSRDDVVCMLDYVDETYNLSVNNYITNVVIGLLYEYCKQVTAMYDMIVLKFELDKYRHETYRINTVFTDDSCLLSCTIVLLEERLRNE